METKSRYEALADLEAQKRSLINSKFALTDELIQKEKELKMLKRGLEDREEEVQKFRETMEERKQHFDNLILAVEKGIEAFTNWKNDTQKK